MSYNPNFVGQSSAAPATGTATGYVNGTGSTIAIGTSVSINTSGNAVLTNVTSETSVEGWIGLAAESTAASANGLVISSGRLQNISTALGFSVGDPIWLGPTPGTLTNVRPDTSVSPWASGDWVVFIGIVVQNEFNNTQQDIQISKQIIGQL